MKKLNIVFEDKNLLVVNKEGGLPTISSFKYDHSLYNEVFDYLHKKNQKVFIVHRLDMDTSGLVLFAKNEKCKNILQENWENTIRKYYAVVHGSLKKGSTIESYLKETKTLMTYSSNDRKGKYAKTIYDLVRVNKLFSLLDIEIKTGRKNQIRVHMHDNNTPILGDRKYGKKDGYRKLALCAYYLKFNHPVTHEWVELNMGIPKEFISIMDNVK